MQTAVPLACFLSVIRPPGVQYENSLLQIAPVDKSKCPYVKDGNDVAFQLFTRHNPTVHQDLKVGDDEKLFASNMDFHDKTVLYFHAWMETPEDGSAVMVREAYMQRGDTNMIMVDARSLQAGPWYFTAAQNTWYIGRFAGQFIDYLVTRGLNLNNTHLVGHSLGAHVAGVAGSALKSGKVARITGLDAALPLFDNLPLQQRLDPTDAKFVDTIHTDAGIFGYKAPIGHVDFYPNAGISPQPGCELEVVIPKQLLLNKFFCSHWRSYQFYTESVIRPIGFKATECSSWRDYKSGACAFGRTIHMGYGADTNTALSAITGDPRTQTNGFYTYYLTGKGESTFKTNSLEYKLEKLFTFIQAVRAKSGKKDDKVTLDKVKANIDSLYDFKDSIAEYLKDYNDKDAIITKNDKRYEEGTKDDLNNYNDDEDIGKNERNEFTQDDLSDYNEDIEAAKVSENGDDSNKDVVEDNRTRNITEDNLKDYDDKVAEKGMDNDRETTTDDALKEHAENDDDRAKKGDNMEPMTIVYASKAAIEDQIAEESSLNTYESSENKQNNRVSETLLNLKAFDTKARKRRDLADVELTVVSGNLTLNNENNAKNYTEISINTEKVDIKINERQDNTGINVYVNSTNKVEALNKTNETKKTSDTSKIDAIHKISDADDNFEINIDDKGKEKTRSKKISNNPIKFNIFRPFIRPLLRQLIRMIPRINNKDTKMNIFNKNKIPKFAPLKNKASDTKSNIVTKLGAKFRPNIASDKLAPKIGSKFRNTNKSILKRQKRFLPFFQKSEDNNNILFKMLDFLIKNRKNVLPVFTVVREINTLVKSGNGELNHFSKESNNYIGATPPVFTPVTYNLELGNENRMMAFIKKLFGVVPKGDRLTISGSG